MAHSIQLRLFLTTERCEKVFSPGEELVLRRAQNPRELVLDDASVTRLPEGIAHIRHEGDELVVHPTEDANPIILNGEKVTEPRPLRAGDRLRVGFSVIVVHAVDPFDDQPKEVETLSLRTGYLKGREELTGEAGRLAQWSEGFDELKSAENTTEVASAILRQLSRLAQADRAFLGMRTMRPVTSACRELAATCVSSGEVERLVRWFNDLDPKSGVLTPTIKEVLSVDFPGNALVGRLDHEDDSWFFYLEPGLSSGLMHLAYRCHGVLNNLLQLRSLFQERDAQHRWVGELTRTVRTVSQPPDEQDYQIVAQRFVFRSARMASLCRALARAAAVDCPVLLLGEPGTGKQLAAEALHAASQRRHRRMVAVSITEYPEDMIAAELFGTFKGAFTSAVTRAGLMEHADGGTLFLDEIGEVPLPVQAKLLRVLQEGRVRRLGTVQDHRVDFRLITATNRDLLAEVRSGRFRQDLYDRIGVIPIVLPPLRNRLDDIPLLAQRFLDDCNTKMGKEVRLSESGIRHLGRYAWPDNVRGLKNYLERTVALADFGPRTLGPDELPPFNPAYGSVVEKPTLVDEIIIRLRDGSKLNQARILSGFRDSAIRMTKDAWSKQVGVSKPIFRAELQKLVAYCLDQGVSVEFFEQRVSLRPENWDEIQKLRGKGEAGTS